LIRLDDITAIEARFWEMKQAAAKRFIERLGCFRPETGKKGVSDP